VALVLELDQCD